MIRRRDQVRLSLQKLALRKKRAAFAIISVALGVIVVVVANCLLDGIRNVAVKTMWSEEIDPNEIKVYVTGNPYDYMLPEEEREKREKKRSQFLTEESFEEIRGWREVAAADRPLVVQPVRLVGFAGQPRPVTELNGVPVAMLQRFAANQKLLAETTNAIPLIVGERNIRLRLDETGTKLVLENTAQLDAWLGREIVLVVGDNYARLPRYRFDYNSREFSKISDTDQANQRASMNRNMAPRYDMTIYDNTLSLRGRVVGFCPGKRIMIPLETSDLIAKWIDQRNQIASLEIRPRGEEVAYERRGRRTPRTGEYTEGVVLVKDSGDVEAVAKRLDEMGFYATSRTRAFEAQARAFDSSIKIVKRIAFAFGAVIFGLACGLIWSTTSKTVSDSRVDIGLFRALGATKRDIRRLFLSEAVLQGVLGTVVGILVGWGVALAVSRWVIGFARRSLFDAEEALLVPDSIFSISVKFAFLLVIGAGIVSLLAGLLPANRAANVDPVKALKRE